MQRFFPFALMATLLLLVWCADAATATKRKTPVKKGTPSKSAPSKTASKKKAPAKKGAPKKPAVTWRNRQLAPTPDRYREIQSALAAKGYLKPEDASGAWNQNSTEALKRFQADQNLDSSGKINSLSLIALGLGPRRDTASAASPPKRPQ